MKDENLRFVVDAMLGNIATKLRLFGFDATYFSDIDDEKILQIAKKQNRILISKDSPLIKKALKNKIRNVELKSNEEISQILEINHSIDLGKFSITASNTRCPKCNGNLESIDKNSVQELVPKGVLQRTNEFWSCQGCKKVYWEGTHIKNLQEFTKMLNEQI